MKHAVAAILTTALLCAAPIRARGDDWPRIEEAVETELADRGHALLAEFADLLQIPNVFGDSENIERNAQEIVRLLTSRGVDARLLRIDGASPIVYGRIDAPGATRTIGVYLHYDGQPVDASRWTTGDPWRASLYTNAIDRGGQPIDMPIAGETIDPDWRLYARSAGDDKAPLVSILGALDALGGAGIDPTVNVVFFFEGEEEAGSPNLERHLEAHRELIDDIDGWLFCDGPIHQSGRPQLVFGVRGVVGMEITVYGAARPLHSGHYGNWAPNPALMLSQLLAGMKDDDGNVVVDGFFDTVTPLSPLEQEALARVPRVDEILLEDLALARTEGSEPYADRLLLPSLNIRGIRAANVGEFSRNVVPNVATASLDIRLVKGCDPEHMMDLVEAHIRDSGYTIVRHEPDLQTRRTKERIAMVTRGSGYVSARTSMDIPVVQEITRAARRAAGPDLVLLPSLGGSLPIYLFTDGLGKPVVIAPVANHDNNQHAEDENVRIGNLWYGVRLMASMFTMTE